MDVIASFVDIKPHFSKDEELLQDRLQKDVVDNEKFNLSLQIKKNCLLALGNISKITDHLYLSGATSLTPSTLEALEIHCVINAAQELPDTHLPGSDTKYIRVPVYDNLSTDLTEYFDFCADAINEMASSGRNVLVHCVAGASRSASLCIGYLMKYRRMSLLDAYNYVRQKRPIVRPNCSFVKQLIDYENALFGSNSVSMVYNEHLKMMIPEFYSNDYKTMSDIRKHTNSSVKG